MEFGSVVKGDLSWGLCRVSGSGRVDYGIVIIKGGLEIAKFNWCAGKIVLGVKKGVGLTEETLKWIVKKNFYDAERFRVMRRFWFSKRRRALIERKKNG